MKKLLLFLLVGGLLWGGDLYSADNKLKTSQTDLSGLTASVSELNYNDITTPGTAEASKALVVDTNKDITSLRKVGVGTTSPAAQLSVLSSSTSGITQISTCTVGTNPRSIYVSGKYAYVANTGSNNISVVDVSNPLSPVQISSCTV